MKNFINRIGACSCMFLAALCLFSNASAQYTWKNVAIGAGGFVSAIITSKTTANVMYARTDVGGAYRWNAATSEWIPLNDWAADDETGYLGVESIALDPQNNNKVYMLVGISYFNSGKTAVLRSSDGGATFSLTDVTSQFKANGNGMGRQNGEKLIVDPNNSNTLFCGTRANGLFKSTNGGVSWTNVASFPVTTTPNENGISFVLIDPNGGTSGGNSQKIFVGVSRSGSSNFYVSTNGGTSFTAVANAPTTYMPQRAVLASDGNMYITYGNGAGPHGHWAVPEPMDAGQIWKYNTSSGTWTNITPAGITRAFGGISVDPANANRVIASTINTYMAQYTGASGTAWGDRFFLSTNGGTSWRDLVGSSGIVLDANGNSWIDGHAIHWAGCIEFNPFNTNQAWVTSGNGVFSCDNLNAAQTTWKFNVKGLEETVPLDIVSIPAGPVFSAIGDYDGFKHIDITQYPPMHNPAIGTTTGITYAANNTSKLVRVGGDANGGKMYYTTNQGTSWTQTSSVNGYKGRVALSADGNTLLHCPEGSSTTYRSTNNGSSWSTCNGLSVPDAMPVADHVNSNKFYVYYPNTGAMMISTDGGANFTSTASPGTWGSKIIRAVPGKEGHLWVAMYNGGLKRSTNSGASFQTLSNVTYCAAVGLGKAAPTATYHTIYIWGTVGGVRGAFKSIDEGATWTRINSDAQEFGGPGNGQFVIGDMNVYGRAYLSTAGRGIVYVDTNTPLPVVLVTFTASAEGNKVKLDWQTSSEINNDHFEIERSADGVNFTSVKTVAGAGNSSSLLVYSAYDDTPLTGISYYRLKQVDKNGAFTYSQVREVNVGTINSLEIYPVSNGGSLYLRSIQNMELSNVRIIDMSGKVVVEESNISTNEAISVSSLPPGIYVVCLAKNQEFLVLKLVKQ